MHIKHIEQCPIKMNHYYPWLLNWGPAGDLADLRGTFSPRVPRPFRGCMSNGPYSRLHVWLSQHRGREIRRGTHEAHSHSSSAASPAGLGNLRSGP